MKANNSGFNKNGIRILKSFPNPAKGYVSFGKLRREYLRIAKQEYESLGKAAPAQKRYETLKKVINNDVTVRFSVKALSDMAMLCLELNKHPEAIMYFIRVLFLDGLNVTAKESIKNAGTADKGQQPAGREKAILFSQYFWFKALFVQKERIKFPRDGAAVEFARICIRLNRIDEAEQKMREAIGSAKTSNPDVYAMLGQLRMMRGDKFRAKEYYQEALFLDPNNQELKDIISGLS